jgi:chromosome segregation ATPase
LKALYLLIIILLCSTSLHAEQVSILTELEQIQEKLWHLNRETGACKVSLEEQQKQLGTLASDVAGEQLEFNERLNVLSQATTVQQEKSEQMESSLQQLGESLAALAAESKQQNGFLLDQAGMIDDIEKSLNALRAELVAQQTDTGQVLADLRSQYAQARAEITETRLQLETLGQNVGGRVEQIGYLGAGAALILAVALIIVVVLRKN